MLNVFLITAFVILFLALLFAIVRLWQGPTTMDRILIFDLFASIAVSLMAVAFMWLNSELMLDIALLLAVVSFVGTVAFARHLATQGGEE